MTGGIAIAVGLAAVATLHGAIAGTRASAGRDGRLRHRRAEGRGALRGISVVVLCLAPVVVVALWDAGNSPDRWLAYDAAARALMVIYGPVAAVTAAAFIVARTAPWPVRAFVNTVVMGGLEFTRPLFAWAGVAAAWWASGDIVVGIVAAAAVSAALVTCRVTGAMWYSGPARIPKPARLPVS